MEGDLTLPNPFPRILFACRSPSKATRPFRQRSPISFTANAVECITNPKVATAQRNQRVTPNAAATLSISVTPACMCHRPNHLSALDLTELDHKTCGHRKVQSKSSFPSALRRRHSFATQLSLRLGGDKRKKCGEIARLQPYTSYPVSKPITEPAQKRS